MKRHNSVIIERTLVLGKELFLLQLVFLNGQFLIGDEFAMKSLNLQDGLVVKLDKSYVLSSIFLTSQYPYFYKKISGYEYSRENRSGG